MGVVGVVVVEGYSTQKYGKFKKKVTNSYVWHTDIYGSDETVPNIFGPYLRNFVLKIWGINKKLFNFVNFLARKISLFF